MKTNTLLPVSILLVLLMLACRGAGQDSPCDKAPDYYYGIEINGILCGYSESYKCPIQGPDGPRLKLMDFIQLKMTLLGQDVDMAIRNTYVLDTSGLSYSYCKHEIDVGEAVQVAITEVADGRVYFTGQEGKAPEEVSLTPDVIFELPLSSPHLVRDFVHGGRDEAEYRVFDDMQGKVVTKKYKRLGKEQLELAGKPYQATLLEELNQSVGTTSRIWIEDATGFTLRVEISGRTIYLADASVRKKIRLADMDNLLFARVDKVIPDLQNITYMKVKAEIQSAGEWITTEGLNARGQKFTGTVVDNFIDGTFELASMRYSGANSPGFPYDHPVPDSLGAYLLPGKLIESDHPDLVIEAGRITAGSQDAWEAAVRLSRWVSDHVEGAVPGGTSAINTYRTRKGECGSHSRLLAALCRAAGIPARLSIGCMYSTYLGGSFGQHAWTEVYMGEEGWIAIDATAEEYDYIDAGHIRLGENASFNPRSMEILEYRVGTDTSRSLSGSIPDLYVPYLGKYTLVEAGRVFTVRYQDGSMVVDIPDRMALALDDPDGEGRWYPKLTRQVNFTFEEEAGVVDAMCLEQLIPVPREEAGSDTEQDPLAGRYTLAQANVTFTVMWKADSLMVEDPVTRGTVRLIPGAQQDLWTLEGHRNKVRFERGDDGKAKSLIYYEHILLERGEPASVALRKWIDEEGPEAGISRFREMRSGPSRDYIVSEADINALGYSYLNEGKMQEAIALFLFNAQEFPGSWNVYDSLGEAYMKNGDTQLAIDNYEHSISLNPKNENGKQALEKLTGGQ